MDEFMIYTWPPNHHDIPVENLAARFTMRKLIIQELLERLAAGVAPSKVRRILRSVLTRVSKSNESIIARR